MKKHMTVLLGVACLSVLVIGISLFTSTPAPAAPPPPTTPVTVTNTPLPVQGAVNANITNGTVPVTGTVNVGSVASLPAVTLNSGSTVSINSSEFAPVFVEAYAAAANNPYGGGTPAQGGTSLSPFQDGQNSCTGFQSISSGTRLVVESISLTAQVPTGTTVENAYFGVNQGVGGVTLEGYLVPVKVSSNGVSDYWVASSPIRGYFTSSTPVGVGITTTPGVNGLTPFNIQCVAFGHTVPGS